MFNKILIITIFLVLSPAILATNKGSAGMLRQQGSQIAAAATTSDRILDKSSQSNTALALAQAKEKIASLEQQVKQFNAAAMKSGVREHSNAGRKAGVRC